MKKTIVLLAVVLGLVLGSTSVYSEPVNRPDVPPGLVRLGMSPENWSWEQGTAPGSWFGNLRSAFHGPDFTINYLEITYDPDPMIVYAIGVTDIGAPSNFSFSFLTPIVPVVGANVVSSSFSLSVTDAGDGSVLVTAWPPAVPQDADLITEIQVATLNAGTVNMGHDLGPSQAWTLPPTGSGTGGPYYETGAGPLGAWNTLQIDVNFGLSGGGDVATMNGAATINPIPEPATLLLLGAALMGLAAVRRFRK